MALAATGASSVAIGQGRSPSGISVPVSGVAKATGQEFFGTFSPSNAVAGTDGKAYLQGTLRIAGAGARQVLMPVALPTATAGLAAAAATCNVLNLVLGPLHLNLLGLEVDLAQVVLNITANPAGGLLGQLLCALAGGLPLADFLSILNQILDLFR